MPLGEKIHIYQAVSVPLAAPREGSCYTDGYTVKWGPNAVLMCKAPIPGLGAATGSTGVTVMTPLLDVVSCLKPAVSLPDLVQGLVDTQLPS
jgi:hypothetical protein